MSAPPLEGAASLKAVLVIGHGREESLCHRLLRAARDALSSLGAEIRVHDLLADGFDPVLRLPPGARHALPEHGCAVARRYQDDVRWMGSIVIVHPVWWFGPPAILKGWVDQVLVHGVAIAQQAGSSPEPLLSGKRAMLIQTFNAPRAADRFIMRGITEHFWRRAVFLSTGIALVERIAVHGAEGISAAGVEAAEQRISRAARKLV